MRNIFEVNPENYSKQRKSKIAWHKVLSVLCAIMVFCTTYALILPGLTADKDLLGEGTPEKEEKDTGISMQKQIIPNADGSYTLRLESYVTGQTQIVKKNEPVDIVLLLDASGSMDESLTLYKYTPVYSNQLDTNSRYYARVDSSYKRMYYCGDCVGWFDQEHGGCEGHGGNKYVPTTSASDTNKDHYTFYTRTTAGTTTKAAALKDAAAQFVEDIAGLSAESRISIVKFSGYSSSNYIKDETKEGNVSEKTQVVKQLTPLTGTNVTTLNNAIKNMPISGATAADYGMTLASKVLANARKATDYNRKQYIIMFTDGDPNHGNNFDKDVANSTIALAKDFKAYDKAKLYTIGCFSGDHMTGNYDITEDGDPYTSSDSDMTNLDRYMHFTSSNFRYAESLTKHGDKTYRADGTSYYRFVDDVDSMMDTFETISEEICEATVQLDENAMLTDYISEQYELKTLDKDAIGVFTSDFLGMDAKTGLPKWDTPVPLTGVTVEINSPEALTKDNVSGFVTVKGFDFSEYYVDVNLPEGSAHVGKKLIVTIPIKAGEDVDPGVNPTNAEGSGIYTPNEEGEYEKTGEDLPQPKVESPAQITASLSAIHDAKINDKNISFKATGATASPIYEEVTEYADLIPLDDAMDTGVAEFVLGKDTTNKKMLYAIDHTTKGESNPQKTKIEVSNIPADYILYAQIGTGEKQQVTVDPSTHTGTFEFVPTGVMSVNFILDYAPTVELKIVNEAVTAPSTKTFDYEVSYTDYEGEAQTLNFTLPANTSTDDLATKIEGLKKIPLNADVKITEINTEGYAVLYFDGATELGGGKTYTAKMDNSKTITVQNITAGILPATGSRSAVMFTVIGSALMLIALAGAGVFLAKRKIKDNAR